MFKKVKPAPLAYQIQVFPHCDPRILHAPGECEVCDKHFEWQQLRNMWGIAFTGYEPEGIELPCPADHARGDQHTQWEGNQALKPDTQDLIKDDSVRDCPAERVGGACSVFCSCKPGWGHKADRHVQF